MNYFKLYDKLVKARQINVIKDGYEVHHILPRCLGGSDDPTNLVRLSYREHLFAHILLSKMHPDSWGLSYAVYMMCAKVGNNSRAYESSKLTYIEKHRARTLAMWQDESYLEKQSFRTSDEFRQFMSDRMKQVYAERPDIIERMKETKRGLDYSLIWTEERKLQQSEARKGVKMPEGFSEKMSKALKGRTLTDEWKQKISASKTGTSTGESNAMADPANRAKVALSKVGRKMVNVNGTRRYLKPEEFDIIKDEVTAVKGKLHYTGELLG